MQMQSFSREGSPSSPQRWRTFDSKFFPETPNEDQQFSGFHDNEKENEEEGNESHSIKEDENDNGTEQQEKQEEEKKEENKSATNNTNTTPIVERQQKLEAMAERPSRKKAEEEQRKLELEQLRNGSGAASPLSILEMSSFSTTSSNDKDAVRPIPPPELRKSPVAFLSSGGVNSRPVLSLLSSPKSKEEEKELDGVTKEMGTNIMRIVRMTWPLIRLCQTMGLACYLPYQPPPRLLLIQTK